MPPSHHHPMGSNTNNETCTLGGRHIDGTRDGPYNLPEQVRASAAIPARGVAGPDPSDPRILACCAPYPVHHVPPCALFCQYDPTIWSAMRPDLFACLRDQGVEVHSRVTWHSGRPWWQDRLVPGGWQEGGASPAGFLAIVVGVFVVVLVGSLGVVRWRRRVWWRRTLAGLAVPVPVMVEESTVRETDGSK